MKQQNTVNSDQEQVLEHDYKQPWKSVTQESRVKSDHEELLDGKAI